MKYVSTTKARERRWRAFAAGPLVVDLAARLEVTAEDIPSSDNPDQFSITIDHRHPNEMIVLQNIDERWDIHTLKG